MRTLIFPEITQLRCAISNTGPMLSAFQSEQTGLLRLLYDKIYIPDSTLPEYEKHGAGTLIKELIDSGFVVVCHLTEAEKDTVRQLSEEIANHPLTKDKEPQNHYPEAETMALMMRESIFATEILLDEFAAREIAQKYGMPMAGFPSILIIACRRGAITPEEVKKILIKCQQKGTHYSNRLIEIVYNAVRR